MTDPYAPQPETPPAVGPQPMRGQAYQPQWSGWVRQSVAIGLVIATVFAATLLAPVLQVLIWSFILALIMFIPARALAKATPLNFAGSVIVVYVILLIIVGGLVAIFIPALVQSAENVRRFIEGQYTQLIETLRNYTSEQGLVTILNVQIDLNPFVEPIRNTLLGVPTTGAAVTTGTAAAPAFDFAAIFGTATGAVGIFVGGVSQFLSTTILALFLSFLILLEMPTYQGMVFRAIPAAYHREIILLITQLATIWRGFLRGQLVIGIIIGVLTYLQLALMGVSQAALLAIITAIVSLIPTIGGIIALIPLGLGAALQGSTVFTEMGVGTFTLLVVVVNVLITQVIWNVVAPKILGDAVRLPLPVIILGVFLGAGVGGILGAFLAVPILGTIRVIVLYLISKITLSDPFPGEEMPPVQDLATL
ncbi:MAG: AI-2E family transporter [Anaerolineae bacterium]|nr:AI-2E family transporter [Anaerolineae bacterium]